MGNPPVDWDATTGRNIVWSVPLGNATYGRPVVAGGVVYVGTDNTSRMNPEYLATSGVLMAFRAEDGEFLWQDVSPRVQRGLREFLLPSTTGTPYVEGNRLYYVTAECQLRSLDTQGFRDGENNGPYRDEIFQDEEAADIVWELDMCGRLGVFPHEATNSDVVPVGDLLMVSTSNGQNEGHTRVPAPRAPSLIAVDKQTGEVIWRTVGPGAQVLHGQWSSPVAIDVGGRTQVLSGGGDGVLRAYDAASGREVWRFDGNPKDAPFLPRPRVFFARVDHRGAGSSRRPRLHRHGARPDARKWSVADSRHQPQRPRRRHNEPAALDVARRRPCDRDADCPRRPAVRRGTWAEPCPVWTRARAPSSGSTTRTRPSGEA
jgi:hypothetical protein